MAYVAAIGVALSAMAAQNGHTIDASRALDAGGWLPAPPADIVITPIPADPTPMVERSQWVFDLRWDRGEVWLVGVNPVVLPAPRETPRAMGRFALELFEGPALIERVRFDFPLLGAPDPGDGGWKAPPSFAPKLRTRIGVVFPASARGTRLELWDRATNRRWEPPWAAAPARHGRSRRDRRVRGRGRRLSSFKELRPTRCDGSRNAARLFEPPRRLTPVPPRHASTVVDGVVDAVVVVDGKRRPRGFSTTSTTTSTSTSTTAGAN